MNWECRWSPRTAVLFKFFFGMSLYFNLTLKQIFSSRPIVPGPAVSWKTYGLAIIKKNIFWHYSVALGGLFKRLTVLHLLQNLKTADEILIILPSESSHKDNNKYRIVVVPVYGSTPCMLMEAKPRLLTTHYICHGLRLT